MDNQAKTSSATLKPETGMVAYFDILGYLNFLSKNTDDALDETAIKVIEYVSVAVEESKNNFTKNLQFVEGVDKERFLAMIRKIRTITFSDTILMTWSYEELEQEANKGWKWSVFIFICSLFSRQMFDYGMPVRGVLSFGRFFVKDGCFAGKPIVDAYSLSTDLDLAITVIDKEAEKEMRHQCTFNHWQAVEYLAPRKSGIAEELLALNIAMSPRDNLSFALKPLYGDLAQRVSESFWAHNKTVSPKEHGKLQNTEMFLRFLKLKVPGQFLNPRDELNPITGLPKWLDGRIPGL